MTRTTAASLIATVTLGGALVLAACGGGDNGAEEDAASPPQPTPAEPIDTPGDDVLLNQVCPPEEPDHDDGFCDFVASLHHDLDQHDYSALFDKLSPREIACTSAGGPCDEPGETVQVLPFTHNDEGTDTRIEEVETHLDTTVAALAPEAEDDHGPGQLQLFAIAVGVTETQDRAIVLTGIAGDDPGRFALMFHVVLHDGEWLLPSLHLRSDDAGAFLNEIVGRQSAGSFWKWQLVETIDPPLSQR